jgi:hypothetical protein
MVNPDYIYYFYSSVSCNTAKGNRRASSSGSYPVNKMWKKLN